MYTTNEILDTLQRKNLPLFTNASKDYNLNLIGIRTVDDNANKFNDYFICLWPTETGWKRLDLKITTDPGMFWREHPMNVNGTAILCEGHHKHIWSMGKHRGKYKALVQTGLAAVYRDNNKDGVLDMLPESIEEGRFGINFHRASANHESGQVDKWSAGCQVAAAPVEYDRFMSICDKARDNWGNKFSYTLLLDTWIHEETT